jgi:hypothetical protein
MPTLQAVTATEMNPSVAVLICSSDNRRDVLDRVLPSITKYWPNCPYPLYVGLNSNAQLGSKFEVLVAKPSEWRTECMAQIAQIPATHVIVVLDDFLFQQPVDQARLADLLSVVSSSNLACLRLLPVGVSLWQRLAGLIQRRRTDDIQEVKEGRPFYSSLQIAAWSKAHFLSLLELPGSIWDFEHLQRPGISHYTIARSPPIVYTHLVERGRWLPYAKSLLERAGLPADLGARQTWSSWKYLRLAFDAIRFWIFGYANY